MYFVNDMPTLSPEPFAGEEPALTECFSLDIVDGIPRFSEDVVQSADILQKDCQWEWIIFKNDDNHMLKAKRSGIYIQDAHVFAGSGFDYENSENCVIVCGYTKDGRTIWGKSLGG